MDEHYCDGYNNIIQATWYFDKTQSNFIIDGINVVFYWMNNKITIQTEQKR